MKKEIFTSKFIFNPASDSELDEICKLYDIYRNLNESDDDLKIRTLHSVRTAGKNISKTCDFLINGLPNDRREREKGE